MTKYSFETFEINKNLIHYYIFITPLPPSYFVSHPHSLLSLSLSLSLFLSTHIMQGVSGCGRVQEHVVRCMQVEESAVECMQMQECVIGCMSKCERKSAGMLESKG